MFLPWQISPEVLKGDFSSLETEMKHLQAQLSDSLKELHQKELRIQQLNSKVLIPAGSYVLYLLAVRDKECGDG